MEDRLRAVCDLTVPSSREYSGLHTYDGRVQDLSPSGVTTGLGRLGGPPLDDAHDEAHLSAAEDGLRVLFEQVRVHRRNPLVHIANLDVSVYDRPYGPEDERADARRRHLSAWPDAVDAAVSALDEVAAPVAKALLPAARGLAVGVEVQAPADALAAHRRFVAHLGSAAEHGPPDIALGGDLLARLLSAAEALPVDLTALAARAESERKRMHDLLVEACGQLAPGQPVAEVVASELRRHPAPDEVIPAARALTEEALAFTAQRALVPFTDGECRVGPTPPSRRWATAMMSPAAPFEPDLPSWYHITPPDPSWPEDEQSQWLELFAPAPLAAITVHEVAPGHYSHGRAQRRVRSDVRRALHGEAFIEGWAHYTEELMLEEGFRSHDSRFALGVALEALVRVTRLQVSLGVHGGSMTVEDAARLFTANAFFDGPAARAEAERAAYDPTYGRYTWGKLALLDLREEARRRWGAGYSHLRFHTAVLALGSPPLGLLEHALDEPADG